MPSTVACPSCRNQLNVPDDLLGQLVPCPACGQAFTTAAPRPAPHEPTSPQDAAVAPEPLTVIPAEQSAGAPVIEAVPAGPWPPGPRRSSDFKPHRGALILILGVLSLVACGLFGPFAWVMGSYDLREIAAGRMDPEGEGQTRAGRVCAIIGTLKLPLEILGCGWVAWLVYRVVSQATAF